MPVHKIDMMKNKSGNSGFKAGAHFLFIYFFCNSVDFSDLLDNNRAALISQRPARYKLSQQKELVRILQFKQDG